MFRRRAKPEPPPRAPLPLDTPFAEVHPEWPLDGWQAGVLAGVLSRELEARGHRAEVVSYADELGGSRIVLLVHTAAPQREVQEVYRVALEDPFVAKELRKAFPHVLPEGGRRFSSRACTVALGCPPLTKKQARQLDWALEQRLQAQGVLARVMGYGPPEQHVLVVRAEGDPARPAQLLAEQLADRGVVLPT